MINAMTSNTLEDMVKEKKIWRKLNEILDLYKKNISGDLVIEDPNPPKSFPQYLLRLDYSLWIYAVLIINFLTIGLIYITQDFPLLLPLRYLLGSITVLFLPGYTLIQALYKPDELSPLEELALSIGLSLAIVPLIGLILNYTPWGIRLTPIVIGLNIFTISMCFIASIRRYRSISL
ncbi:MAG: DUF1616 domain-containing protein [Fervidicoccaceae archaeon]